jgi:hypothetical protein
VADKDLWVLAGIPKEYNHPRLIVTDGYSIENDLYLDADLESLMTKDEKDTFDAEMREFLKWYAFAIQKALGGERVSIDCRPERVLENGSVRPAFAIEVGFTQYDTAVYDRLRADYAILLRGKSLWWLLMRRLSYPGRPARHNYGALLEMASSRNGPRLLGIKLRAEQLLATAGPP